MADVKIYHNPKCGTSRNTLGLIRNAGIEPEIIEYLKPPPDLEPLRALVAALGTGVRGLLRIKGTPAAELGLDNPACGDAEILAAMVEHPILIERPVVITPLGVRLCRPSERVLDILPAPQQGAFSKEDGTPLIGADGQLIR